MWRDNLSSMQAELQKFIPNLISGGCIHFAYYFSKALKKLGVPYKVYMASSYRRKFGNSYKSFTPVSHILVFVEDVGFIDGHETLETLKDWYACHAVLKLQNLNKLRFEYEWNDYYSLASNNLLEQTINKYIK